MRAFITTYCLLLVIAVSNSILGFDALELRLNVMGNKMLISANGYKQTGGDLNNYRGEFNNTSSFVQTNNPYLWAFSPRLLQEDQTILVRKRFRTFYGFLSNLKI